MRHERPENTATCPLPDPPLLSQNRPETKSRRPLGTPQTDDPTTDDQDIGLAERQGRRSGGRTGIGQHERTHPELAGR